MDVYHNNTLILTNMSFKGHTKQSYKVINIVRVIYHKIIKLEINTTNKDIKN